MHVDYRSPSILKRGSSKLVANHHVDFNKGPKTSNSRQTLPTRINPLMDRFSLISQWRLQEFIVESSKTTLTLLDHMVKKHNLYSKKKITLRRNENLKIYNQKLIFLKVIVCVVDNVSRMEGVKFYSCLT